MRGERIVMVCGSLLEHLFQTGGTLGDCRISQGLPSDARLVFAGFERTALGQNLIRLHFTSAGWELAADPKAGAA